MAFQAQRMVVSEKLIFKWRDVGLGRARCAAAGKASRKIQFFEVLNRPSCRLQQLINFLAGTVFGFHLIYSAATGCS
jgi:hypothetical protein